MIPCAACLAVLCAAQFQIFCCSFLYLHFVFDLYKRCQTKKRTSLFIIMLFYQVIPDGSDSNVQLLVDGSRGQHLVGLQRFSQLLRIGFFDAEIIPGPAASNLPPVFLSLPLGLRHYLLMFRVLCKIMYVQLMCKEHSLMRRCPHARAPCF